MNKEHISKAPLKNWLDENKHLHPEIFDKKMKEFLGKYRY
jgi:hypothetical protein